MITLVRQTAKHLVFQCDSFAEAKKFADDNNAKIVEGSISWMVYVPQPALQIADLN